MAAATARLSTRRFGLAATAPGRSRPAACPLARPRQWHLQLVPSASPDQAGGVEAPSGSPEAAAAASQPAAAAQPKAPVVQGKKTLSAIYGTDVQGQVVQLDHFKRRKQRVVVEIIEVGVVGQWVPGRGLSPCLRVRLGFGVVHRLLDAMDYI